MKRLIHKRKFSFATNFSWWFGSPGTESTAGFSRASWSTRSPAEARSRNKGVGRPPPTEVGGKQGSCNVIATARQETFATAGSLTGRLRFRL